MSLYRVDLSNLAVDRVDEEGEAIDGFDAGA